MAETTENGMPILKAEDMVPTGASSSTQTSTSQNNYRSYEDRLSEAEKTLADAKERGMLLSDIVGDNMTPPDKKELENAQKRANVQRKAALVMDSFRLIGDALTTAGKGRVYARDTSSLYRKIDDDEQKAKDKYERDLRAYEAAKQRAKEADANRFWQLMGKDRIESSTSTSTSSGMQAQRKKDVENRDKAAKADIARTYQIIDNYKNNGKGTGKENKEDLVFSVGGTKDMYTVKDKGVQHDIVDYALLRTFGSNNATLNPKVKEEAYILAKKFGVNLEELEYDDERLIRALSDKGGKISDFGREVAHLLARYADPDFVGFISDTSRSERSTTSNTNPGVTQETKPTIDWNN